MTTLTIGAAEFRSLLNPVLPMASKDEMIPSICAVLIESDGKWLYATATDRFRVGIKRIAKRATDDDPTTEWPEFRALLPNRAIKSLLTMFKPTRGSSPATITLTVEDDKLTAEAVGLFDMFDSGRFVHHLATGEFPKLRNLVREALATPADDRASTVGINPDLMADFKACGAKTLRVVLGAPAKPLVVTDDEGFLGLLMPRRLLADAPEFEDWSDYIAPRPEPEKSSTRKDSAA